MLFLSSNEPNIKIQIKKPKLELTIRGAKYKNLELSADIMKIAHTAYHNVSDVIAVPLYGSMTHAPQRSAHGQTFICRVFQCITWVAVIGLGNVGSRHTHAVAFFNGGYDIRFASRLYITVRI